MDSITKDLLHEIKQNKKYKSIADEIIIEEINNYLKKNKISSISTEDIKEIRSKLHRSYSSFQTKKKNKIEKYLDELKENPMDLTITHDLLSTVISTKERLEYYPELYQQIFEITGKPKIIVDIGAGFNIFSYPFMDLTSLTYYSYDINEEDKKIINKYLEIMKIKGKAEILDAKNLEAVSKLPLSDLVFLFKLIDVIDKDNHKPSEELIKQLISKTKFIVASFATRTITRKKMNFPNRKWFELMLERLNLKFQTIKTEDEIFYIICR